MDRLEPTLPSIARNNAHVDGEHSPRIAHGYQFTQSDASVWPFTVATIRIRLLLFLA